MPEATISHVKNHLPELVHRAEEVSDIHITRHGKPVAVLVSLERYESAFSSGKGIFNAYLRWRNIHADADGFTDKELDSMRDRTSHSASKFNWAQ